VQRLIRAPERLVIGSALLAGVTGLLLGVSSGRIRGVDDAGALFGMIWVASIAAAIAVFATGGLVTSRAAAQLIAEPTADADVASERGGDPAFRRLTVGFGVELGDRIDPGVDGRARPLVGSGQGLGSSARTARFMPRRVLHGPRMRSVARADLNVGRRPDRHSG
jgi:hypothetical protein